MKRLAIMLAGGLAAALAVIFIAWCGGVDITARGHELGATMALAISLGLCGAACSSELGGDS